MKNGLLLAILPLSLFTFFLLSKHTKVSKAVDQYTYAWQSKSVGYSDIQHLYQVDTSTSKVSFFNRKSLQSLGVSINCRIKKTIISSDSKGELASFQITDPLIEVVMAGQTVNCDLMKQELTHPVLVELSRQGLIKIIRIDTAITNSSANMIKGILSHLQFVRSTENKKEWQLTEENTSGPYLAKYRQVKSDKNGFEFEKMNAGYTDVKIAAKNQQIIDNGNTNFSTDTAGAVVGIDAADGQIVLVNADTVALSNSVVRVKLESTNEVSGEELASLTDLNSSANYNNRSTLCTALSEDKINRMAYSKTLGNDNLGSLMAALGDEDEKGKENLILKFRALVYLFPERCEDLTRILKGESFRSYAFNVLSSALANAETETAINALVNVIDARRTEEETVIELLPSLATAKAPTELAVKIGKELAFSPASTPDMASTAQLALGGMAYNFKKTDEKRSARITRFLLDKMKAEKDTIQKIMVLANTGSPTILPVLKTYLEHPGISKEVRVTAISGLRLMNDNSSLNYLNRLVNNKDTVIVKKAKEVIAFQKQQL